ncbi:hypothetical protein H6P81_003650 [Aristolochia fimbriata]|uniref:DUF7746 domain-containing protein n=1 Tax=Aristolochia fimbriata TaxID=158543 RepID=A0AAV7FD76_ARIFI|nr:hypothetical protein H6P81_003650 [Aristolochia fimbriata]
MLKSRLSSATNRSKNVALDEYAVDVQDLTNWSIPKIPTRQIYNIGSFALAWSHVVKTLEQSLAIEDTEQTIELLTKKDIYPFREKYKFIHIGCVQVALKPLTIKGLDTSMLVALRDARCLNWANSLMGVMETSLTNGHVYFNIYPDLALSLSDPHLLKALSLNLRTHNYDFMPESETITVIYRIYYRVLNTLTSKVKIASARGKTTLIEYNELSTKTVIPRTLKWDEISFPSTWQISEATAPRPLDNREVEQIIQDAEGNVEIVFAPNIRQKIPLITSGRKSSSSIPVSESSSQPTPEMADLYTDLRGNPQPEWQLSTGTVVKAVFPPKDALTIQGKANASIAVASPVEVTSSAPSTLEILQTINQAIRQNNFTNLTLEAIEKQLQQLESKIVTLSHKRFPANEASTSKAVIPTALTRQKPILLHQPPVLKLPPTDQEQQSELLKLLLEKLGKTRVSTIIDSPAFSRVPLQANSEIATKWQDKKPNKTRPPPFDIHSNQENPFVVSNSYDARTIYEWNIDHESPKGVVDTLHRMFIYCNVCRAKGLPQAQVVNQIVAGLTGDLYGWWYHYLSEDNRHEISYVVKLDESGDTLLDNEGHPISDAFMTFCLRIMAMFTVDPQRQAETTMYLLHHLRCRTLTDLDWYISTFRSRVMTLADAANPYWKQCFIEGLPTQFSMKVKPGSDTRTEWIDMIYRVDRYITEIVENPN